MKEITLDFKNRWILINTDAQETSEDMWELIQKPSIKEFIPSAEMYMHGDNFTFDFENNYIYRNRTVTFIARTGYSAEDIEHIEAVNCDNLFMRWDEFIDRLGYANIDYEAYEDYKDTISFLTGNTSKEKAYGLQNP